MNGCSTDRKPVSWSTCGYSFPLECRDEEGWVGEMGVYVAMAAMWNSWGYWSKQMIEVLEEAMKGNAGAQMGTVVVALRRFCGQGGCQRAWSGGLSDVSVGAGIDTEGGDTS